MTNYYKKYWVQQIQHYYHRINTDNQFALYNMQICLFVESESLRRNQNCIRIQYYKRYILLDAKTLSTVGYYVARWIICGTRVFFLLSDLNVLLLLWCNDKCTMFNLLYLIRCVRNILFVHEVYQILVENMEYDKLMLHWMILYIVHLPSW